MKIIYNKLAGDQLFIALIIGGLISFILYLFIKTDFFQSLWITSGIALSIIDISFRKNYEPYLRYGYHNTFIKYLTPSDGGSVLFIPTWVIGIAGVLVGLNYTEFTKAI